MLTGGEGDLLPWYRFPAYPFLAILGAWGLQILVQKANLFTSFLAAGLLLGGRSLLVNPFKPNITPSNFRIIFIFLLLPSIFGSIFEKEIFQKLTKIVTVGIIIIGMYLNVVYIYNEFEIVCQSVDCPLVPTTFLSTMYFPFIWRWIAITP